jgi:uncharacterized protein YaiE (UPF0345 family)
MPKPNLAQLLTSSGYTTYTPELISRASASLYGNVGAGLDSRDWDAIMAADNPLQASEDALIAIYQGNACLLDNANHLQDKGYSGNMIEWTVRQMQTRLGINNYDNSWADGTWMEVYAQKSDTEVYNDAKADVPNPPALAPVTITTNAAPFDTTAGTGMISGETADTGTDNTIEIAAAAHLNGSSVVDGLGGTNTVSLTENIGYDLTQGDTFSNVNTLDWSNNITVTVNTTVLGGFGAVTGAAGAGDQVTLDENANFDFSTTALTGVETVATASATAGKTYTFDAADLNDVTTVTGQNTVVQTVALNDAVDLSGITFTDMETLTFGDFVVNLDTGNLASFSTITGAGAGTLDLNEDADYDFRTTALTGVSTITATGVSSFRNYYLDAADLNAVTTITGTNSINQGINLTDADDLSGIDFTDIEVLGFGAFQVDIDTGNLASFNSITGDGVGSASILNLNEDADYDFSSTLVNFVPTITALNATDVRTYTFNAADLNAATAVTGTTGQDQIFALKDSDDLSNITFTDMETLSFGNFTVNIDAGNLASFNTITGGGTGTLDLKEDVDYDFSSTALTGVSTITTTGATANKTYTFDAADLNDVTAINGEAVAQTIVLNDSDDWTTIATTNIETLTLADGASITNSNQNTIQNVTAINGNDGDGENFKITADASISDDINLSGVTQTNIDTLSIVGNANVNALTGTAGADVILAFDGDDTITGGAGIDNITPGLGNDTIVNSDIANEGLDVIDSFTTGTDGAGVGEGADTLQFSETDLGGLTGFAAYTGTGTTIDIDGDSSGATLVEFVSGAGAQVATAAQAAFLFNQTTGTLSFDADGTGTNAAIDVVTLTGVTDLAPADFGFAA